MFLYKMNGNVEVNLLPGVESLRYEERVSYQNDTILLNQHYPFPEVNEIFGEHMPIISNVHNAMQEKWAVSWSVKARLMNGKNGTNHNSVINRGPNRSNTRCAKQTETKPSTPRKHRLLKTGSSHCADINVIKRHVKWNSSSTWLSHLHLPRVITKQEYDSYMKLVSHVSRLFESANITLVMSGGTLLGSYMFHNMIPWDDDLDLWMPYRDVPKVKRLFKNETLRKTLQICSWGPLSISDEYEFNTLSKFSNNTPAEHYYRVRSTDTDTVSKHFFKIFYTHTKAATKMVWKWPFLDIAVFNEDRDYVRFCEQGLQLPLNVFYPLIKRPLGSNMLMAPRDTRYVLLQQFRNFRCISSSYSHRKEMRTCQKIRIECQKLWSHYPQVWSEPKSYGQLETLMLGNKTLQVFEYRNWEYTSLRPYDL